MNFDTLGLAPAILRALAEKNYNTATPIQEQAIPLVLSGHDLLGAAQTGTGKTAAFALPVLNRLSKTTPPAGPRKPRALILVPTRELAVQVADSFKKYGRHLRLNVNTLFGGVGMQPQVQQLRLGVDVLVACPGRLIDHLDRGSVKLDAIEVLVMDEADRMLDMGFLPAIKRIVNRLPKDRQTLMFSATFEARIKQLALEFMNNPKQVQVAQQNVVANTVTHRVHPVDGSRKKDLLVQILAARHNDQVLVFGKTKHGCNRLAEQLEAAGLPAVAIHGNKSQGARQKALSEFKSGKARILVATDVAARGLDIPDLPLVINHDLPMVAEDYVHRIGRTGRNGAKGEALSLVCAEEGHLLKQIQRVLSADILMENVPGFAPSRAINLDMRAPKPAQRGPRPQRAGGATRSHAGHGAPGGAGKPKAYAHAGQPAGRPAGNRPPMRANTRNSPRG